MFVTEFTSEDEAFFWQEWYSVVGLAGVVYNYTFEGKS